MIATDRGSGSPEEKQTGMGVYLEQHWEPFAKTKICFIVAAKTQRRKKKIKKASESMFVVVVVVIYCSCVFYHCVL